MMLEDHGVQIGVETPAKPQQCCSFTKIQAHTNYVLLVWLPLCQTDVRLSHKTALMALGPFQTYILCVVFDINSNIMAHFQPKM
jgi:hypothetical protein